MSFEPRVSQQAKHFYEFGAFKLYPAERLLLHEGQPVPMRSLVFDLMVKLVENAGAVLSREDLLRDLWHETHVEDANLTVSISTLRKTLARPAKRHPHARYIETVPKRGYRFIASVKEGLDRELGSPARSIAVLPFQVVGATRRDAYLGLGLTDTLITKLSGLSQLTVRQTSAVRRYTYVEQDPVVAGRKLGVDTILAGTVRRQKGAVRATVRLIDVSSRALLWVETFDHKLQNIFLLEDLISEQVTQELKLKLSEAQKDYLGRHHTESTAAYQLYLKGRYHWNKRTPENLQKALDYFKRAIKEDEEYALAYAGLADAYILLNSLPPRQIMPAAKQAAEAALEIDAGLAEAHCALAFVKENFDWDWPGAEESYRRALKLNPSYATAHQWYAEHLAIMGRHEEGLREIKSAQRLDPLSLSISNSVARQYYFARQYEAAIEQCHQTLEMDQEFLPALYRLGGVYLQSGRHDEAIRTYQRAVKISGNKPVMMAELGYAYAVAGRTGEAERVIEKLRRMSRRHYLEPGYLGQIMMGLGQKEQAFAWLCAAYEARSPLLIYLNVEPIFDSLRSDKRFRELLRRLGLVAAAQKRLRRTK